MKNQERDERLVYAAERSAAADERVAHALGAPERRLRAQRLDAAFPSPRRLFGGERGAVALLRSIPGFAELWRRSVPERALRSTVDRELQVWRIVYCECGDQVALRSGALADCDCGRWFFSTGRSVRVKRFEAEAA